MTLTTHIVTGAVAARAFNSHPVEAFVVGMVSHYVLDSIVHWDYKIDSISDDGAENLNRKITFGKTMFFDVGKVLLDAFLGFAILFCVFFFADISLADNTRVIWLMIAGAIGGVMPDFLQFLYGVWKITPLRVHQKFHHLAHAKKKLDDQPWIGVPIQVGIVASMIFINFLLQ